MEGGADLSGDFDELLERARFAYQARLGAGAMIYLRKIFEAITVQVADIAGIETKKPNGRPKSFAPLLKEVDAEHHIIPPAFSSDGYLLFSELSEMVHGHSSEEEALAKYRPCESLVRGIIHNVASDLEMRQAIDELGWTLNTLNTTSDRGIAS